jgi:hypothetical protein
MTKSDGTMSALIIDLPGGGVLVALVVGACANAEPFIRSNKATAISRQSWRRCFMVEVLRLLGRP